MSEIYLSKLPRKPLLTADQEVELATAIREGTIAAWETVFQDSEARKRHGVRAGKGSVRAAATDKLGTDKDREELISEMKTCPPAKPHWERVVRARDRMVQSNLGLVLPVASKWTKHVEINDGVQEGCIGLMRAAYRFDPASGNRFSTYATWWIRQSLGRVYETRGKTIRVPEEVTTAKSRIYGRQRQMSAAAGAEVSSHDAARALGMSDEHIERVLAAPLAAHSLNMPAREAGEVLSELQDLIQADVADPAEGIEATRLELLATGNLKRLGPIMRDMLVRRYGHSEQRMHEIAASYGTTRERVRSILEQAGIQMALMNKRGAA